MGAPRDGTSTLIMNMSRSRSTASTISTFLNPLKRTLGFKKSSRGTNALYRAISSENWELVISICVAKPYKAEKWHNAVGFFDAHRSSKILPLHQACIFHPTKDAIHHIIQAYPHALRATESGYGRVPLHIACHSNASPECIHELAVLFPAASVERDIIGRVPLHYALSNGAATDVVEELLNAATQAYGSEGKRRICSVADFNGWLPVHVACFMGASARVLSMLIHAYPEGADSRTKKNSTPMTLLKGISLSPQKKEALESILLRRMNSSVKYAARISPARTDIEKVVRMSDETCSKGVTLEIDEGETSSLSSMEGTTTTVRTGTTNKRRELPRKHLQYGGERRRISPPAEWSSPHDAPRHLPSLLPTHAVYNTDTENVAPVSFPDRKCSAETPIRRSHPTSANPDTDYRHSEQITTQKLESHPARLLELRSRESTLSSGSAVVSKSSPLTNESHSNPTFQLITSTAVFC